MYEKWKSWNTRDLDSFVLFLALQASTDSSRPQSSGKYSETSTVAEQAFFSSTGNYVTEKGVVRPHTEHEISSAGTATAPVELTAHQPHKVEPSSATTTTTA